MLKEERFEYILRELKSAHKVYYEKIARDLNVSEDTIRRDLDTLHKSGLLIKVRGGGISPAANPLSFQDRDGLYPEGKSIVALKAQQMLKGARTVFMDGGTTMLELASSFPPDSKFRIITNNIAIVPVLSNLPLVEIVVLGGTYNRVTKTNVGQVTCREAGQYHADLYLMGICAIDDTAGVTAAVSEDGEVKKAFIKSSRKTVVLSTAEKVGTTDFFRVCSLEEIDAVITDLPSDDKRLDPYRLANLEII